METEQRPTTLKKPLLWAVLLIALGGAAFAAYSLIEKRQLTPIRTELIMFPKALEFTHWQAEKGMKPYPREGKMILKY